MAGPTVAPGPNPKAQPPIEAVAVPALANALVRFVIAQGWP
jgi:hypothetical protein